MQIVKSELERFGTRWVHAGSWKQIVCGLLRVEVAMVTGIERKGRWRCGYRRVRLAIGWSILLDMRDWYATFHRYQRAGMRMEVSGDFLSNICIGAASLGAKGVVVRLSKNHFRIAQFWLWRIWPSSNNLVFSAPNVQSFELPDQVSAGRALVIQFPESKWSDGVKCRLWRSDFEPIPSWYSSYEYLDYWTSRNRCLPNGIMVSNRSNIALTVDKHQRTNSFHTLTSSWKISYVSVISYLSIWQPIYPVNAVPR